MKSVVAAVMVVNLVWHALATYHFLFFPTRTLARYTSVRPISEIAAQVFKFLGALNFSLVAFAALSLLSPAPWQVYVFFAMANFSQLFIDIVVHRAGYTKPRFILDIMVGDGVVFVLNVIAAVVICA